MAAPRKPSDRNRRIFENSTAYRDAIAGHPRLAAEIESRHLEGAPSVVVQTYRALIRAVGFYKYNSPSALLLRGQTRCFGAMKSSIHRRTDPPTDREIETFLDAYRTLLRVDPSARGKLSTEPLLQHYGIATRWLDLVDSVPHALFFATHQMVKSPLKAGRWTYVPSQSPYGFIYLMDLGEQRAVRREKQVVTGYTRGNDLLVADLRKLRPSLALRPHAQHGLLVRDSSGNPDLWNRVVARIAVPTQAARQWINAAAFTAPELFPPRHWDGIFGTLLTAKFERLLTDETAAGRSWGEITRYDFHD